MITALQLGHVGLQAAVSCCSSLTHLVDTAPAVPAVPSVVSTASSSSSATGTAVELPNLVLSFLVWSPLLAGIIVLFMPERTDDQKGRIRVMGLAAAGLSLLITLLVAGAQISNATQSVPNANTLTESHRWLEALNFISVYHLDVDGVSLPLLQLSTLLFSCAMLYSWKRQESVRLYVGLLLILETAITGVLCAQDLLLFAFFWGLQIAPLFLLIRGFGSAGSAQAAMRYLGFALISWVLLLVSVILMVAHAPSNVTALQSPLHSFDLTQTVNQNFSILAPGVAKVAFVAAMAAFGISAAVVPVHRWMIDAVDHADGAVAALIAGVVTKLGIYGMMRIALAAFPTLATRFSLGLVSVGIGMAIWAGCCALACGGVRRMVGYLSVAQTGIVLVGLGGGSLAALIGAVLLLVAEGLATALLLYVGNGVAERTRTDRFERLGGLAWQAPRLAGFWLLASFSLLGVPLLAGFSALFMLLVGAFPAHHIAVGVAAATLVGTTFIVLRSAQRIFFGPLQERYERVRDTTTLDLLIMVPLVIGILLYGVLPGRIIPVIAEGAGAIATRLGGG